MNVMELLVHARTVDTRRSSPRAFRVPGNEAKVYPGAIVFLLQVEKTLKKYGDVGIAEQQKVRKQAGMMA